MKHPTPAIEAYTIAHEEALAMVEKLQELLNSQLKPGYDCNDWTRVATISTINAQLVLVPGLR